MQFNKERTASDVYEPSGQSRQWWRIYV